MRTISVYDKFKSRKKKNTRWLIGAKNITDYSLETYSQGEVVFFIVKPSNLAVLSNENIDQKLHAMTTILKSVPDLEFCCQNSRESFEDNKVFLKQRIEQEESPAVRQLCRKDMEFLDRIQLQMATAREFTLMLRFKNQKPTEIITQISRVEKLLKEQGFEAKRAEKADIQRILAVYFEQNISQMRFDERDGARWGEQFETKPIDN